MVKRQGRRFSENPGLKRENRKFSSGRPTPVSRFSYIIINTPLALGILTVNALTASHDLIIPSQADVYSLQGIGQLYQTSRSYGSIVIRL
jgi:cellulose biosynthesis protein BcsQ